MGGLYVLYGFTKVDGINVSFVHELLFWKQWEPSEKINFDNQIAKFMLKRGIRLSIRCLASLE